MKCICEECDCGDTWKCLHNPNGHNPDKSGEGYCKCCVDDSTVMDDGMIHHKQDLMELET